MEVCGEGRRVTYQWVGVGERTPSRRSGVWSNSCILVAKS